MENAIVPNDSDIIDQFDSLPIQIKRAIAEAIRQRGTREVFAASTGQKHTYMDYFAIMLWDAVVEGIIHFADGKVMDIKDNPKAWTDIAKFMAAHVDGPVSANTQFNSVNVYKVYQNIDIDRI